MKLFMPPSVPVRTDVISVSQLYDGVQKGPPSFKEGLCLSQEEVAQELGLKE
jgi:hypothetical protein